MVKLVLHRGDITKMAVDAVVNAANSRLAGGGGVDGAIHRAAGWEELQAACRKIGGCPTGEARITPGFRLPAKYIIHAVGPVWQGGTKNEEQLLYSAYQYSLKLACEHQVKTIAFPCISTGIYGFPKRLAAQTALKAIEDFICNKMPKDCLLETIYIVVFDDENEQIYLELMGKEKVIA